MKKIPLHDAHHEELQKLLAEYEPSDHLIQLERFFADQELDLTATLTYGLPYLPNITETDGTKNLDRLEGFVPQVVSYYEALSRLSFLPETMTDLCTNLSTYANGESIGLDSDIYAFSPTEAIEKALA
jgi:hypothetical protein